MRKLIESTHVSLGGVIGSPEAWAFPYLSDEHHAYARKLLFSADALLLGRRTYEGLSAAYIKMASETTGVPNDFIQRMNSIPKYVASKTLRETTWNAQVIEGRAARSIRSASNRPCGSSCIRPRRARRPRPGCDRHSVQRWLSASNARNSCNRVPASREVTSPESY